MTTRGRGIAKREPRAEPRFGAPFAAPATAAIQSCLVVGIMSSWTARVEILGFDQTRAWMWAGEDWAQALELSAKALPIALETMVHMAGGGTLEPPFYERELPPPTELPPAVQAVLGRPA